MPPAFRLPKNVGDALLQYLARQPYIEVHELIEALRRLEPVPDASPIPRGDASPSAPNDDPAAEAEKET